MNLRCYFNLNWLFLLNFWIYSKKISYIGSFAIPIICQCVRDKFSLPCTILHFFHCSTAECAGNMVKRHFKTSELIRNFTVLNGNHIWFLDLNEKIQKRITKKLYAWGLEPTSKKFYKKIYHWSIVVFMLVRYKWPLRDDNQLLIFQDLGKRESHWN